MVDRVACTIEIRGELGVVEIQRVGGGKAAQRGVILSGDEVVEVEAECGLPFLCGVFV